MSRINKRSDIKEINEIPEVHSSMVGLDEMSGYEPMQFNCSDLQYICPTNIVEAINAIDSNVKATTNSSKVCSPSQLNTAFTTAVETKKADLQNQPLTLVEAQKVAVLSTLIDTNILISEKQDWAKIISPLLDSDNIEAVNHQTNAIFRELEASHTNGFANNLAKACASAGVAVGFRNTEIKPVHGKLEVISTNELGQRLVSEIQVDKKTRRVHAATETLGITDGSCNTIIQKFNHELREMGIQWMSENSTFTGGSCKLPFSKRLENKDSQARRKKKEQERTQKLNSNHRLKQ